MIDQRWTTINGSVWKLGKDKYRATVSLINDTFYAATVEQMTDECGWEDIVSYATFQTRDEAEEHILQVIERLTQLANTTEGENNAN